MINEIKNYIDEVAKQANLKKIQIGMAYGISEDDMNRYVSESDYRRERKDIFALGLNWFRKTKNQDLKDRLTIEGIKKGFSVRAEKTMGALPEYQSVADQNHCNRFDLSWETTKNSRNFILAVEIEMDLDLDSIFKDFKKLTGNHKTEMKVMICQAKNKSIAKQIAEKAAMKISQNLESGGSYLLSVWTWDSAKFRHYTF